MSQEASEPKANEITDSPGYFYTVLTVSFLGSLILIANTISEVRLSFFDRHPIRANPPPSQIQMKLLRTLKYLRPLCSFFFWCVITIVFFSHGIGFRAASFFQSSLTCHSIFMAATATWGMGKASMYSILVIRLWLTFEGTAYDYSRSVYQGYLILASLYTLYVLAGISLWSKIITYFQNGLWRCHGTVANHFLIPVASLDIFFTISLMVLFIRPILKMYNQSNEHSLDIEMASTGEHSARIQSASVSGRHASQPSNSERRLSRSFLKLVARYSLLTCLGTGSTLLALIVAGISGINIFVHLDAIISPLTLALIHPRLTRFYRLLCALCDDTCVNSIIKPPV